MFTEGQSRDIAKGYGIAEETVGRWLQRSGRRDDIVLATKVLLIPALRCLGIGIGLIPYSPLHAGLLAGMLEAVTRGFVSDASALQRVEAHRDPLEAYEGLCRELSANPAAVAIAWLLRNPVVSTTIVGAMTLEELRSDLGALSVQLDAEVMEQLDQIWPGPGEAPQAYAW
jgi:aryl-alcohol dehydrogenase-like predicted oxidoreductase